MSSFVKIIFSIILFLLNPSLHAGESKTCNEKVRDLERDLQSQKDKYDFQIEYLKKNDVGTIAGKAIAGKAIAGKAIAGKNLCESACKGFKDEFCKDFKEENESKLSKSSTSSSAASSTIIFDSVDSAPHLFVTTKETKLEKAKCVKNARNKMSNVGFKNIVEKIDYGVWGLRNGYKGHILCGKKIAIFNVVGNDKKVVVKYAEELKENF